MAPLLRVGASHKRLLLLGCVLWLWLLRHRRGDVLLAGRLDRGTSLSALAIRAAFLEEDEEDQGGDDGDGADCADGNAGFGAGGEA